jgi:hypothetical protein
MTFPKWATTVTTFSKALALIIFITFPIIGFVLGIQYQKLANLQTSTVFQTSKQPAPAINPIITLIPIPTNILLQRTIPDYNKQCPKGFTEYKKNSNQRPSRFCYPAGWNSNGNFAESQRKFDFENKQIYLTLERLTYKKNQDLVLQGYTPFSFEDNKKIIISNPQMNVLAAELLIDEDYIYGYKYSYEPYTGYGNEEVVYRYYIKSKIHPNEYYEIYGVYPKKNETEIKEILSNTIETMAFSIVD